MNTQVTIDKTHTEHITSEALEMLRDITSYTNKWHNILLDLTLFSDEPFENQADIDKAIIISNYIAGMHKALNQRQVKTSHEEIDDYLNTRSANRR